MDDIFIIKLPSAPTIQQKNTMRPTEKIEPKSVEQVNLKHRQLNGDSGDNRPVFVLDSSWSPSTLRDPVWSIYVLALSEADWPDIALLCL